MFNALAYRQHSYLHKVLGSQQPAITNRHLYNTMFAENVDRIPQCSAYLLPLASMQPQSYGLRIDHSQARVAYGYWGIPQLCYQLSSPRPSVRHQALGALTEQLIDPEKCYRAVQKWRLLPRLAAILEQELSGKFVVQTVERLMFNLQTVGGHLEGALRMAADAELIGQLFAVVTNRDERVAESARVLVEMAQHYPVADLLVGAGYLTQTLAGLQRWPENCELYQLLAAMAERSPQAALDAGSFEFLVPRLAIDQPCQPHILRAFALAIQCDDGQRRCDQHLVLPTLLHILDGYRPAAERPEPTLDWRPRTAHLEYAAMAMHSCLVSSRSRWLAQTYWRLCPVLVRLAHCRHNWRLQLHALQALRHATEMPTIKAFVRTVCKQKLRRVECSTDGGGGGRVRQAKAALLRWLRYKNYHLERLL